MKILVACEESQAVTIELRRLGHEAYSCDLEPCSGGHPEWHIMQDALPLLNGNCTFRTCDGAVRTLVGRWDMIIAHPPCTDIAASGARWFTQKIADGRQQNGINFFMKFVNADCPRVAIENPVGVMSTVYRKPDCKVQPWNFGDPFQKATCFWLKGLPVLIPEITSPPEMQWYEWTTRKDGKKRRQPMWYYDAKNHGRNNTGKNRSKTFPGIARAMAEQWAGMEA